MSCEGNYIKWIYDLFGDCIVSTREKVGFGIGLSSTFIWMWAQIPQMVLNYKNKKTDGISPGFLCLLVTGDLSNFIGIVITHGLATQYFTSLWFLFSDFFVTIQYVYYTFIRPKCLRNKLNEDIERNQRENLNDDIEKDQRNDLLIPTIPLLVSASQSLMSDDVVKTNPYKPPLLYGTILGWVSAICYIASRMPQIITNFKRKKTEGLSPYFFITAFLGNTTYGVSIFLKNSHWDYIWSQFPWLVGSLGILFFDFTILFQFAMYNPKRRMYNSDINNETKAYSMEFN